MTRFEQAQAIAVKGATVTLHSGHGYHYGYDFGRLNSDVQGVIEAKRGSQLYIRFAPSSPMASRVRGHLAHFNIMAVLPDAEVR